MMESTTNAARLFGLRLSFLGLLFLLPISFSILDDCYLSEDESCSIEDLKLVTRVFPGGRTACWSNETDEGDPNPYYFTVNPGSGPDRNNLLLHFQGGGGCSSNVSGTCSAFRAPFVQVTGMFNKNRRNNAFQNWTTVIIAYCSGDLYTGDQTNGAYEFRGRRNVYSVLNWTEAAIPSPHRVILAGTSAGSIALHYWAYTLLRYFKQRPTPPDYLGVLMSGYVVGYDDRFLNYTDEVYGFCEAEGFGWEPYIEEECRNTTYFAVEHMSRTISEHRDVPFFFVSYKKDATQAKPYSAIKDNLWRYYNRVEDPVKNNIVHMFLNVDGHALVDSITYYQAGNGRRETVLDMFRFMADYDRSTTIPSSCRNPRRPKWRPDYNCDKDLTKWVFQPKNSTTCHRRFQKCRSDADCCKGKCGVLMFFDRCGFSFLGRR